VQAMRKYLEFCPEHHISFSEKQEQIQSSFNHFYKVHIKKNGDPAQACCF